MRERMRFYLLTGGRPPDVYLWNTMDIDNVLDYLGT